MRMANENEITSARAALGFSQAEIAAALGVNQSTVCRWENGTPLSPIAKRAIAALLAEKKGASAPSPSPTPSQGEADAA